MIKNYMSRLVALLTGSFLWALFLYPAQAGITERLQWLTNQQVPNSVISSPVTGRNGLVISYAVPENDSAYPYVHNRSWIYDNALAIIAFTLQKNCIAAYQVADALDDLVDEQGHLGFSYNTADNWGDTLYRSGAVAWVGYALMFYQQQCADARFQVAAENLANGLLELSDPTHGSIRGGPDVSWFSTEHNIDAYFFLRDLGQVSRKHVYADAALKIKQSLLTEHWNDSHACFQQGIGDTAKALDTASWGAIFLNSIGEDDKANSYLDFLETTFAASHQCSINGVEKQITGYRPYGTRNPDLVWSEGSLGVALAYQRLGQPVKTQQILAQITQMQGNNQGILYSCPPDPDNDFHQWESVAGTAWTVMLESANNSLFWDKDSCLPVNSNLHAMQDQAGNLTLQQTRCQPDARLIDFETESEWSPDMVNNQLAKLSITEETSGIDLTVRFDASQPWGRVLDTKANRASSGTRSLAYDTSESLAADIHFNRSLFGVGFVLHRLFVDVTVSLLDKNDQVITSSVVPANSDNQQEGFSHFAYRSDIPNIRSIRIDTTGQLGNVWWLDDLILMTPAWQGAELPDVSGVVGANIDETMAAQVLHVSITGNDANPGTEALPLRHINTAAATALQNQQNDLGTRILIHPGVYRETVDALLATNALSDTQAPIIFEEVETDTVTLSGSEVQSGWELVSGSIYRADWSQNWGAWVNQDELPLYVQQHFADNPILRRREMLLVDRELLRQYINYSDMQQTTNSFFIDEENDHVYIHLHNTINIETATVEAALREYTFKAKNIRNLVIRGIRFEHAANALLGNGSMHLEDVTNVLLEDNHFDWNAGTGWSCKGSFDISAPPYTYNSCRDLTARNNTADYNGIAGIETLQTTNTLLEDNHSSYNNWRGDWGNMNWGWTGNRLYRMHDAIIRRHTAVGNQSRGLWLDFDASDILLEDSTLDNNWDGLKFEVVQGPILVRNTSMANNGNAGLLVRIAKHITLENNQLESNAKYAIEFTDEVSAYLSDWQSEHPNGNIQLGYWTLTGNSFGSLHPATSITTPFSEHFFRTLQQSGEFGADGDRDLIPDKWDGDDDNDGMSDEWETEHALDRANPVDAVTDSDDDGLTHLQEFNAGTDPHDADSDDDDVNDGDELAAGTNPNDSGDYPLANANRALPIIIEMLLGR